eukprot:TRINITY_DN3082_c0_g1_i3.p1 TRINITY_DN3082_c0_g1~~TRINITY_DN3082_c0_g1_i3.p1  ORF type:complete len:2110 (+),score=555.97 TRINITY_DN3082_c0_g1_i3:87-6332(+)
MKVCVEAAATAADKTVKDATAAEKQAWTKDCQAAAKAAFEAAGGKAADFAAAQREGAQKRAAEKMRSCVESAASAASKTIKDATAAEKRTWTFACQAQAKAEFEAAGGDGSDWDLAQRDGAEKKAVEQMKVCLDSAASAANKAIKDATPTEKQVWIDGCEAAAKAVFEAAGGSADDWEQAQRDGAEKQAGEKMKSCVEKAAQTSSTTLQNASAKEKREWVKACESEARAEFEAAGGDAKEWDMAQRRAAESKGTDAMKECFDAVLSKAGKTLQTATAQEKLKISNTCRMEAKAAFETAGGEGEQWDLAIRRAAENQGSDKMKACFDAAILAASKTYKDTTSQERLGFQQKCEAEAKAVFEAAGGSATEWDLAQKRGAERQAVSKISVCIEDAAKAVSKTMDTATQNEKRAWSKACEKDAKAAFEAAGGNVDEWEVARDRAAESKAIDKLKACFESGFESAGKTLQTAPADLKRRVSRQCEAEAKAEFEAAGGRGEEWELAQRRAAEDQGADKMRACVDAAAQVSGKTFQAATASEKKSFQDKCAAEAKALFEAAGGKAAEWELAQLRGAERQAADKMRVCIDAAAAVAKKTMAAATDAEKRSWAKSCDSKAKAAFEAAGGDVDDWELSQRRAAENQGMNKMKACFNKALEAAGTSIETATDDQKRAMTKTCAAEAKADFEAAGGRGDEWDLAQRRAAENQGASTMKACIEAAASFAEKDVESASTSEKRAWAKKCEDEAKAMFEAAGGSAGDFQIAVLRGAERQAVDQMKVCIEDAARSASKDIATATASEKKSWANACEAKARVAFEAAGGKADEWALAQRRAAENRGSDKMKVCIDAALESAGKTMKTATDKEKKSFAKGCETEAKAEFEAAGGRADEWQLAQRRAAESKGVSKMQACIETALQTADKTLNSASAQEKRSFTKGCAADAKAEFEAAGGKSDEWDTALRKAAESRSVEKMKLCVDAALEAIGKTLQSATDEEMMSTAQSCEAEAKAMFEAVGGKAEEWELAQRRGAESKAVDKMNICIDMAAEAAKKTVATATATEKRAWRQGCAAEAKSLYEAAGGNPDEWELAQREGAQKKSADKMRVCIEEAAQQAGKGVDEASKADMRKWVRACEEDAKAAFEAAGGDTEEWQLAKEQGALAKGIDKMRVCVQDAADAAEQDIKTASKADLQSWATACEAKAIAEFESAGGNADDWKVAKEQGAMAKGADKMRVCLESSAKTALKTLATATKQEKKAWVATCEADAKALFEAAGGDANDWKLAKEKGAMMKGAEKMRACVAAAATAVGKTTKTATAAERLAFAKACDEKARADFEAAGGSQEEWALAKEMGARSKGADKLRVCINAAADAANKTMTTATAAEKSSWKKTCAADAKADFEAAGGDPKAWALSKKKGAEERGVNKMRTCIQDKAAAAGKTMSLATSAEKAGWVSTCTASARADFESGGGDAKEWLASQQKGAAKRGGDKLKSCIEEKAGNQEVASASADQIKAWRTSCEADARADFEASGGDADVFDTALEESRTTLFVEKLDACRTAAGDDQVKLATCEESAKKTSASMGGDAARFDRDKQDAARQQTSALLKACLDDGGTMDSCTADAREKFTSFGGVIADFEQEKRRGAGTVAGKALKACLKEASNKTEASECFTSACEVQAGAGGNAKDCWFDRKKGLLRWALAQYMVCVKKEESDCDTKAKSFFFNVLKGEKSDWNDNDWSNAKQYSSTVTKTIASSQLDARFAIGKTGSTSSQVKALVDAKKTELETAIKDSLQATSCTCTEASDTSSETKASIGCRVDFSDASAAAAGETKVRNGDADAAVSTLAFRRLGRARRLSVNLVSSEGSQVQQEGEVSATTAPTPIPTTAAPTMAPTPPTAQPTAAPTQVPSAEPTRAPTNVPSLAPTFAPSVPGATPYPTPPTQAPTAPTSWPTIQPTLAPSFQPTVKPTFAPTVPGATPSPTSPTQAPTLPTVMPSESPTVMPSEAPTEPGATPSPTAPTQAPSSPTVMPTEAGATPSPSPPPTPTMEPTQPSEAPTQSVEPTVQPTETPPLTEEEADFGYLQRPQRIHALCVALVLYFASSM